MSRGRLKLGDVVQRCARFVLADLTRSLESLHRLTADSRTTGLRECLNRSKVLLLQLLALCRWIGASEASAVFRQTSAVDRRIADRDLAMNVDLDRMFYLHAALYSMRSHAYDVAAAGDIMLRGRYELLPPSMFLEETRQEDETPDERDSILRSADVFIQAKLLRESGALAFADELVVRDGCLRLSQRGLFSLRLTLDALSESASWRLVEFHFEVSSHHVERLGLETAGSFKVEVVEDKVRSILQLLLGRSTCVALSKICEICR